MKLGEPGVLCAQGVGSGVGCFEETLILVGLGMERTVLAVEKELVKRAHLLACSLGTISVAETREYIVCGERRRVHHVVSKETIVAQFVEEEFVGGEVTPWTLTFRYTTIRTCGATIRCATS